MAEDLKFHWLEVGTTIPLYTVFAKNEKQALKKLQKYLAKIGKDSIELVKVNQDGKVTETTDQT
jgi:hypothetical protein